MSSGMKITRLLALTFTLATPFLPGVDEPTPGLIDSHIAARSGGPLAPRSDDAEFFRRAQLDLAGIIPRGSAVRAFLENAATDKRRDLIDELLESDEFARHWSDLLSVELLKRQNLGKISRKEWHGYLFACLKKTPRWDTMVREMVAATGRGPERPAMKFLGAGGHRRMTEDIALLFLGMDLECARCHDHPSVKAWTQADYWGLYAYLGWTKAATSSKDKKEYLVEVLGKTEIEYQSVFESVSDTTGPRLPGLREKAMPVLGEGEEFSRPAGNGLPPVPKFLPRRQLAIDLTSPANIAFARNSVNRFWARLLGRGIVHPLDQVHPGNPPSHPKLIEALAGRFIAKGFDLKWLLRSILLSDAYQRSSRLPAKTRSVEPRSYRAALPRPLTPEQLLHSILRATGNLDRVKALKADPAEKFDRKGYFTGSHRNLPGSYDEIRAIFIQTFGRPPGEPETEFVPGLNQSLFLMNDRLLLSWLEPIEGNLVHRLTALKTPGAIAGELYLSVLSRLPDEVETAELENYLEENHRRRAAALGELAWALLNSTEFRLNH